MREYAEIVSLIIAAGCLIFCLIQWGAYDLLKWDMRTLAEGHCNLNREIQKLNEILTGEKFRPLTQEELDGIREYLKDKREVDAG